MSGHAGLFNIEDKIRQARVLGFVPVGARQQQAPIGFMRAGGPDFLAVDHPLIAFQVRARDRSRHVGPAAGFAEQLAPGVLPGQAAAQEFGFLHVGAVRQDRRGGQHANAGLGDADRADAFEFLLHHGDEADGQIAAVPCGRPVRRAPTGFGEFVTPIDQADFGIPMGFEPGPDFSADR
jgi:hypothetical protein